MENGMKCKICNAIYIYTCVKHRYTIFGWITPLSHWQCRCTIYSPKVVLTFSRIKEIENKYRKKFYCYIVVISKFQIYNLMKNFNRALNHDCAINLIYYVQYQERRNCPPFFRAKIDIPVILGKKYRHKNFGQIRFQFASNVDYM